MSAHWTDRPTAVRRGEDLNASQLEAYLGTHVPNLRGPLSISQFPAGHSNLTYMLTMGERQLVLRRPPIGAKIETAHDMAREFRILSHLVDVYPKVPRPLLLCTDESVLGAPFYVMERLKGVILRSYLPAGLELSPPLMHSLSANFVDNLVQIHSVDYEAAGLGDLGRPHGYVQRQIQGWAERYRNARTDVIPEVETVGSWLLDKMPKESGASLIHNDYKYDNLVLDPDDLSQILGVLDWEMATIGDPLMDLGTTLGYWVDPNDPDEMRALAMVPTARPGNLDRRALVQRYAAATARDVSNILYFYVYGLFKIAVIAQQIYARYRKGFTQDDRFAVLIYAVKILSQTAGLAIHKGRIDDLAKG
jgi:aminoglycoside phosphotransferase (APT) family kinase protein